MGQEEAAKEIVAEQVVVKEGRKIRVIEVKKKNEWGQMERHKEAGPG